MWAVKALNEWHDFYILVGTAGATLLGLLFVAVSLGAGYLMEERQSATRMFMSPVVIHFTTVFFLSVVALLPLQQAKFLAALIGASALIGAIISTYITIQVVRTDLTNYIQDYLAYGLLPGVTYLDFLGTRRSRLANRAAAWLCTGAQSGRAHMGLLEASRIAQLLPARFCPAQPPGPATFYAKCAAFRRSSHPSAASKIAADMQDSIVEMWDQVLRVDSLRTKSSAPLKRNYLKLVEHR
jgi:hypothetical protein